MRKIIFKSLSIFLVLMLSLCFAQPVFAHGGEPRLEISSDRLNPGSVLELRGVDFEFEEEITLTLIGSQVEIPLGIVTADAEGIFPLTITLPADLVEGTYVVRATTDDHVVESPQITVWGSAVVEEGEGRLDEEEGYGLLAPMPTFPPPTPVLSDPSVGSVSPPAPEAPSRLPIIVVGVLVALGVAILGIRLRNNR